MSLPVTTRCFLVDLGTASGTGTPDPADGFSRVEMPPLSLFPPREGQAPPLLLLQRPFTGSRTLSDWWRAARDGPDAAARTVTVTLLSQAGAPLLRWIVRGARPVRLSHGALDAGHDLPFLETVELAFDSIELDPV